MILERAATVLAERGDGISMAEIAKSIDVGRATIYRYFPTREALITGMADAALNDLGARVADASLDTVSIPEAIARITRAFIANGQYAAVLRGQRGQCLSSSDIDRLISDPIRKLLQRGIDSGVLRHDVSADTLLTISGGLLQAGVTLAAGLGGEQASAVITTILLDGVRNRQAEDSAPE